jgi:apolipoprotein N-acyltransferase
MQWLSRYRWLLIALVLGGASALGFAPLGWWPLTLLAFAGLIWLVAQAATLKSAFARGYWFGIGHFVVGLNWIAGSFRYQESMPVWLGWIAVVLLAVYIAVYPALATAMAWQFGRVDRKTKHVTAAYTLTFAAAWIVTEWMRSWMFTGFAWNPLSVVAVDIAYPAQWIGTYGLSGVVCLAAGAIVLLAFRRWIAALVIGGGVATLVAAGMSMMIGNSMREAADGLGGLISGKRPPLIRIVQPNIGQQDKYDEGYRRANFLKLARLSGRAGTEPRLLLWPEAAIPDYLDEDDIEAEIARIRLSALLGPKDVLLTGGVKRHFKETRTGNYIEYDLIGARNSVFAMDATGKLLARYDKSHLVPYGEYLPAKPILSLIGLTRLVPGTVDFWPGPGPQSVALPGFGKGGVQICYEIIFSGQVIDAKNRPDFLFNPSNDAWFGAWGPPQHLAQARLRAIEEGMPVIRSTPTGISAVIDTNGQVLRSLPYQQAGFIETRMPTVAPPTPFARYGNWLSLALAALLAATGVALARIRR